MELAFRAEKLKKVAQHLACFYLTGSMLLMTGCFEDETPPGTGSISFRVRVDSGSTPSHSVQIRQGESKSVKLTAPPLPAGIRVTSFVNVDLPEASAHIELETSDCSNADLAVTPNCKVWQISPSTQSVPGKYKIAVDANTDYPDTVIEPGFIELEVLPASPPSQANPIQVDASSYQSPVVFINRDHALLGFGENDASQLGDSYTSFENDEMPYEIPQPLDLAPGQLWDQVVVLNEQVFAVNRDGTVWARGRNYQNELGLNSSDLLQRQLAPIPGLSNIQSISVGTRNCPTIAGGNPLTCKKQDESVETDRRVVGFALDRSGNVTIWGNTGMTSAAQDSDEFFAPRPVSGLTSVVEVVGGFDSSYYWSGSKNERVIGLARTSRGEIWAMAPQVRVSGFDVVAIDMRVLPVRGLPANIKKMVAGNSGLAFLTDDGLVHFSNLESGQSDFVCSLKNDSNTTCIELSLATAQVAPLELSADVVAKGVRYYSLGRDGRVSTWVLDQTLGFSTPQTVQALENTKVLGAGYAIVGECGELWKINVYSQQASASKLSIPFDTSGCSTQQNARLTLNVNGSAWVSSSPIGIDCDKTGSHGGGAACSAEFAPGQVRLTAVLPVGSQVQRWSGACRGVDGSSSLTAVVDMASTDQVCDVLVTGAAPDFFLNLEGPVLIRPNEIHGFQPKVWDMGSLSYVPVNQVYPTAQCSWSVSLTLPGQSVASVVTSPSFVDCRALVGGPSTLSVFDFNFELGTYQITVNAVVPQSATNPRQLNGALQSPLIFQVDN